jgi:hypothetical protein
MVMFDLCVALSRANSSAASIRSMKTKIDDLKSKIDSE